MIKSDNVNWNLNHGFCENLLWHNGFCDKWFLSVINKNKHIHCYENLNFNENILQPLEANECMKRNQLSAKFKKKIWFITIYGKIFCNFCLKNF